MSDENLPRQLARLCTLDEPTRRAVYLTVRQEPPASRAQVAEAVGISVSLAAFHLDTLVEAGLLEAFYARPVGRGGPGAGRPAKWYRPSDVELEVSLPARRYDVLASILAEAIHMAAASDEVEAAVRKVARQAGRRLAPSGGATGGPGRGWRPSSRWAPSPVSGRRGSCSATVPSLRWRRRAPRPSATPTWPWYGACSRGPAGPRCPCGCVRVPAAAACSSATLRADRNRSPGVASSANGYWRFPPRGAGGH